MTEPSAVVNVDGKYTKMESSAADGDIVDNIEAIKTSLEDDFDVADNKPNLLLGDLDWWLGFGGDEVQHFKDHEETYIRFHATADPASEKTLKPTEETLLRYKRKFYADTSKFGARQSFRIITGQDYDEARRAVIVLQRAVRDWLYRTRRCEHQAVFGPMFSASRCKKRYIPIEGNDYTVHSRCRNHLCPCMVGPSFGDPDHISTCCICSNNYCSVCGRGCKCHALHIAFPWL